VKRPRGVHVVTRAGDNVPLGDAHYVGRDPEDGLAVWRVTLPRFVRMVDVAEIHVDRLPARSTVEVVEVEP
jgi:hypothetical protein